MRSLNLLIIEFYFRSYLLQGFGRWDAVRGQLCTASIGLLGAFAVLTTNSSVLQNDRFNAWILSFTAGAFLHISLLTGNTKQKQNTLIYLFLSFIFLFLFRIKRHKSVARTTFIFTNTQAIYTTTTLSGYWNWYDSSSFNHSLMVTT